MGSFDAEHYGRLLYSLRVLRKYKSAASLAEAMTEAGIQTSERTIWAIESGRQIITMDRHMLLVALLKPEP